MSHSSSEDIAARLEHAAANDVIVGARYAHYKNPGSSYIVELLVVIESTEEIGVVYRAEYGKRIAFMRPLSSWSEQVTVEKEVVPRFRIIEE